MGFNAMQPGRIKLADLLYLLAAVIVIGGLIVWAIR